jgi:acyl-CoA reductase-like NAD-dependent aldehyde dehydrogenase
VTKENGKKLSEGMLEAMFPGVTLRHTAGQALTDTGISAEVAPGLWFSTYGEPAGVVGIIVPWNSPVVLLIRSLAPALCRWEHGRLEDARADRAGGEPCLADPSRRSSRYRMGSSRCGAPTLLDSVKVLTTEGGFKQSGIGRLRGPLAISDFQEAKTVVRSVPPLEP